MRIGYNTWSMATVPYQVFIPELHKIGYTALAISVIPSYGIGGQRVANAGDLATLSKEDRRRIKEGCEQRQLELSAIVGNASLLEDDPQRRQENEQRLRDTIDFCAEVTPATQSFVPTLNTGTGGGHGGLAGHEQQLVDRLGALCAYAAQRGVTVCIEPHVGAPIDTPERAEWLVQAVNHPSCRLDFDVSHFEVAAIPLEASIPRLIPHTRSVEIKDQNVRYADEPLRPGWRVEGNGLGRSTAPDGRALEFQFLLGGEGDFDLPKYLRMMRDAGWTGAIGFEASVAVQARPNYDALAAAASTYRWMRAGWEAAGVSTD